MVEGSAPALTAAEQAVQQLYRRLVGAQLLPPGDSWRGAEYWCQVRPSGWGGGRLGRLAGQVQARAGWGKLA